MPHSNSFLSFSLIAVFAGLTPGAGAAAAKPEDWPAYLGRDGAHYSSLAGINRGNVAQLQPAWTFRAGDAARNTQIQCNPLIVDGVLYGTTPQLSLFALDAATGRELWRFDPFAGASDSTSQRGVNRGVVLWRQKNEQRLLYTAGNFIHAIDPETGLPITSFGQAGRVDLLQDLDRDVGGLYLVGTSPGAVYRDVYIVSTRVGEGPGPAAPGHIRAYDVRTGKRRWIFHTIPHPGEFGHDTWPAEAWKTAGGANNWAGLVIDEKRGLAFIPTGSAAFDFWGGNRQGANLFADCLLALDALTGERKWHFQFTHHDVWDRDPPAMPVLCQVTRDGRRIDAVAQVTKSGHVWVFDRDTGESLFPWEERPVPQTRLEGEVTWPTQPVPLKPEPFARQQFTEAEASDRTPEVRAAVVQRLRELDPHVPFAPPSERGTIILPGFDGGAEWGGAAVDPDGILYINSNEMPWIHQMIPVRPRGAGGGQLIYNQLCVTCHGPERKGNPAGNIPGLVGLSQRLPREAVAKLLHEGKGMMPAFGFLPPAQLDALLDYLLDVATDTRVAAEPANDAGRKYEPTGDDMIVSDIPYTTTGYNRFLDAGGYPAIKPPWGTLNAIDLNTGDYLWKRPLGELPELTAAGLPPTGTENYGGPLVTAGDLVFIAATKDEKFRAFDRRSGELLWETALPAGGYATPATYAVDGRQYIVIAAGGGKMGTKSGDAYIAFALPAKSDSVAHHAGDDAALQARMAAAFKRVEIDIFPEGTDVVDIFLLLGQSNMKGRGRIPAVQSDDPRIIMMQLRDDQWYCARHPLHFVGEGDTIDGSRGAGVGPGLDFAREVAARFPRSRIALVPGAVGGSGIERWVKGGDLYEAAMKRARLALAQGPAGRTRLRGILWIQGEREARSKQRAQAYQEKLDGMIRAMREDLGQPDLPFIASTAGPVLDTEAMQARYPHRAAINATLLDLPARVPFSACVDARDLSGHIGDSLHYDTPSQQEIGRRLAAAWLKLTGRK